MSEAIADVVIPDRPTFKASEVCDLLKVQPYVLRSWENEFKHLGVARTPGAPRVYRRTDVEMALRIRQLVFGEGLTLAGVRRRFEQERPATPDEALEVAVDEPRVTAETRVRVERAKQALRGLLDLLGGVPQRPPEERSEARPASVVPADDATAFDLVAPAATGAVGDPAPVAADPRRSSRRRKVESDHRAPRVAERAKPPA